MPSLLLSAALGVVAPAAGQVSNLTLGADNTNPVAGAVVQVTASISAGDQYPGSITSSADGSPLNTVKVKGNSATIALATLSIQLHSITATYNGDSVHGTLTFRRLGSTYTRCLRRLL